MNQRRDDFDPEKYKVKSEEIDDFDPERYKVSASKKTSNKIDRSIRKFYENTPGGNFVMDMMKTPKEAIPQRVAALGRGFTDIGEGVKQAYLEGKEKLGYGEPGEAQDYTKKVEAERKFYENTPGGKDELAKIGRTVVSSLPYLLIGNPLAAGGRSLLARMIASGIKTAAVKGAEFVPEGESRALRSVEGGLAGAALPLVAEAPSLAVKSVRTIAKPFQHAFKGTEALEKNATNAAEKYEQILSSANEAEKLSQIETGKKNPESLEYVKNKNLKEISELPPSYPNFSPEEANQNLQIQQGKLKNIESNLDEHLNKGAAHDVRAASRIDEIQNAKKKEIGNLYDKLESNLSTKNIEIKNARSAQQVTKELTDIIKKGGLNSSEARNLSQELSNLEKSKSVKARDYLAGYRTARDYLREARKEAFTPGITDEARQAAKIRVGILEDKVEKMKDILEKGIGEEDSNLLKNANIRWSQEVAPLYKNKLYNQIKFQGRLPDNIIKQLRGSDVGNQLIKKIIKNDPELLRNVVGQRYAVNPKEIHQPNEMMNEYLDQIPELKNLLNYHKESIKKSNIANNFLKETVDNYKNYEKKIDLEDKIKLLDKHIENLKKTSSKKQISLKEKVRTEKELSKALSSRKKARILLGGTFGTLYGGSKILGYLDKSQNLDRGN